MILVTINYEFTEYVRRSICGGMDSEFSHTQRQTGSFGMVVPDDGWGKLSQRWEDYVKDYIKLRFASDPFYRVVSVTTTKVDAIYQSPILMMH